MMNKIIKFIRKPSLLYLYLNGKGFFKNVSDEKHLKILYKIRVGKKLNLSNPETYTEKLQWLKIYDHKDIYTKMVDKYDSKSFISDIVGEKYCVKTLGVWDSFDEIDFSKLPDRFVLKCTHDSGGLCLVSSKKDMNINEMKQKINKSLKKNYFYTNREWPYKNVKPRIIAEELLVNNDGSEVIEYNLFCFNGVPKIVMTCHGDKRIKRYNDFYDMDFNKIDLKCGYDNSSIVDVKPSQFEEMIDISSKLSSVAPQLRVDFYVCNGKLYVGELTFFHWGGFEKFYPEEWDTKLGKWVIIK